MHKVTLLYIVNSELINWIKWEVEATFFLSPSNIIFPFIFSSPRINIPFSALNKGNLVKLLSLFMVISSLEINWIFWKWFIDIDELAIYTFVSPLFKEIFKLFVLKHFSVSSNFPFFLFSSIIFFNSSQFLTDFSSISYFTGYLQVK